MNRNTNEHIHYANTLWASYGKLSFLRRHDLTEWENHFVATDERVCIDASCMTLLDWRLMPAHGSSVDELLFWAEAGSWYSVRFCPESDIWSHADTATSDPLDFSFCNFWRKCEDINRIVCPNIAGCLKFHNSQCVIHLYYLAPAHCLQNPFLQFLEQKRKVLVGSATNGVNAELNIDFNMCGHSMPIQLHSRAALLLSPKKVVGSRGGNQNVEGDLFTFG